ncbi:Microtubule-binding protein MIP-T3 C-terminal region containing protein, putative [Angomonas deanei]|uniref:Microtubule-binding protein MIP-T3 C-terminal region containing protein, putative n=1 Tax=Angomonas deanei TaxID=59799 RepID=A0A7G2CNP0_9TRYP|nr:Microtubule-binding protein MIP-T3 C-terminal region containing protein, putative [Angomonas deanei]
MVTHSAVDAAPVAGVIREAKRGQDADDGEEEEDWQKVAEQYGERKGGAAAAAAGDDEEVKGALGQQALRAKKRQEAAKRAQEEAASSSPAAAAEGGGIVIQSKRKGAAREGGLVMGDSELSTLREQLQLLTKASNPLGKFLEVIHDDIDSMLRELDMWRGEARTQQFAAEDAHRLTEEQLQETQAQLQNLEDAINDQLLKTNNIRRNILANDRAIQGMMRMVINPEVASRQ